MLRTTIAAAALAVALAASPLASAQGVSVNIGVGTRPYYGSYSPSYGYRYDAPRFYDQRYYGDWRDHRGDIRRPDYHPHHHHWYPPQNHCYPYRGPYWDGRYYFSR
jgi:hypothetical protein